MRVALYECFISHGIADSDPAEPPGIPVPVDRYTTDVATVAWNSCKDAYVGALRQVLNDFQGIVAEFPADADPFGFTDCMAALGWITPFRASGPAVDVAGYAADNAACRRPPEGSSAAASYCRLVNAIFDMGRHDQTLSITGIPNAGDDASRLDAAVRLYEELAQVAPEELVEDLRTVQDGFRTAGEFPDDAWTRVYEYHAGVCGAPVHIGSLD